MTKDYDNYKKNHNKASEGFGDSVKKFTDATGISTLVDKTFDALGKDCGCKKRQELWNKKFSYKKPKCFTKDEYKLVQAAVETKKSTFTGDEIKIYSEIFERIFEKKVHCQPCSFPKEVWSQLKNVYELYN